jgi:hypothetical protein
VAAILISHFLLNLHYLHMHPHAQTTPQTSCHFTHGAVQSAILDGLEDHTLDTSVNKNIKLKDMASFGGEVDPTVEDDNHNVEPGSVSDGPKVMQASTGCVGDKEATVPV